MKASEAIKRLLPFPGIDSVPQIHQESRFVENVRGKKDKLKACVFKKVYFVSIESYYEYGNRESWVVVKTGDKSSPEAAMKDWNRLVRRVKKGI